MNSILRNVSCIIYLVFLVAGCVRAIIISIPGLGDVEGVNSTTAWTSRNIFEFRGIRYALPPSGERRFKEPVKALNWTGTLDATKFGQACPQPGPLLMYSRSSFLSSSPDNVRDQKPIDFEDCLTIDVYTPTENATAKLPVLVYFHGGYFIAGSSSALRPGFLLENDIIVVCPQYRLGVLGFYSLNTVDAPGNMGLLDQVMALQWVKDNIAAFGGDPTRVTIAGSGAGGASVSLHTISPRSKGLFQSVIAQSGSALAPWALDLSGGQQQSRAIADLVGCSSALPPAVLANCMRNMTVFALTQASLSYSLSDWRAGKPGFGASQPTIQRAATGVNPFLSSAPETILQTAKNDSVPLLSGFTKHEGIFFLDGIYQYFLRSNNLVKDLRYLREGLFPTLINNFRMFITGETIAVNDPRRYFNASDLAGFSQLTPGLIDFTGTMMVKGYSVRQADLHSKRGGKTYLYSFDYNGVNSLVNKDQFSLPFSGGVTHGDDTIYIFPNDDFPLNVNDTVVAKSLTSFLASFVITGAPTDSSSTIPWPEYESKNKTYMSIDILNVARNNVTTNYIAART